MISRYSPLCLTISLGSDCNLNCVYCYSLLQSHQASDLDLCENDFLNCIQCAAELIAHNCLSKRRPFFLGFQGSGEPLIHFDLLKKIYGLISDMLQKRGLPKFSFITSNGCMEGYKYSWVAKHFDRICLSLDGDQNIHDLHRRTSEGEGTYPRAMTALRILRENRKTPVIRTTVTLHNAHLLVPIMKHFIERLGLREFQVEPVYGLNPCNALSPDPEVFVKNFLAAKKYVNAAGGQINYSGHRSEQPHGPYCNVLKNVLFIGRRGTASACLFRDNENRESPFTIGYYDDNMNRFIINKTRVRDVENTAAQMYSECATCEIRDSCVKGCPDMCILTDSAASPVSQSLRCQINRMLFERDKHEESNATISGASFGERPDTAVQYR